MEKIKNLDFVFEKENHELSFPIISSYIVINFFILSLILIDNFLKII